WGSTPDAHPPDPQPACCPWMAKGTPMTASINVALIGTKFMGRAHSNAWLDVAKFFDVDPTPVMHTVVGRNRADLEHFAQRWGWAHARTDWKDEITADEIGFVVIVTSIVVHAEQSI